MDWLRLRLKDKRVARIQFTYCARDWAKSYADPLAGASSL